MYVLCVSEFILGGVLNGKNVSDIDFSEITPEYITNKRK